jgi:hypothetical protein
VTRFALPKKKSAQPKYVVRGSKVERRAAQEVTARPGSTWTPREGGDCVQVVRTYNFKRYLLHDSKLVIHAKHARNTVGADARQVAVAFI